MNFNIDMFGDIIGLIGMIICLVAFFLIQKKNPNMIRYNLLNMVASMFLFISLCIHPNIASMCLEVFWFVGAVYGLVKAYQAKKRDKSNSDYNLV